MPQPQALVHDLAPQVDVAVAQAHLFADRLVELERQRIGAIEQLQLRGHDLDAAGGQIGVDGAGRPRAHACRCTRTTNSCRSFSAVANIAWLIRMEHDLHQALAVAQVDEDHAAVIAPPMHPAGDRDGRVRSACSLTCPQ